MAENYYVQSQYMRPQFGSSAGNFGMNVVPGAGGAMPGGAPMTANVDMETLKNAGADTFIAQRLTSFSDIDPLIQYGVAVPTWIAINQGMDRYSKLFCGPYDKSISYKIGHVGDVVSDFFTKNPVSGGINNGINSLKNFFKKNIYNKSAVLRAWETPATPELSLVKHQMSGITGMLRTDAVNIMEEFLNPVSSAKDLDCLGATKEQIQQIEKELVGKSPNAQRLILEKAEFKLLNKKATVNDVKKFLNSPVEARMNILKDLKAKALSFKNLHEFELIKAAPNENAVRLLEVLKNAPRNMYSRIDISNKNTYSTIKGNLLGRKEYFDGIFNKLVACEDPKVLNQLGIKANTTKKGSALAKTHLLFMEGATSRISGGKLAAAMQAFFVAEAIIRASRQETNGDKFKSFMERMAECIGFFVFMPPAVQATFHAAGIGNAGMTPQQDEAYRKAVEKFNDKVISGGFKKNYKLYQKERKALEALRPKTKNPLVWFARNVIGVGLDQIRPYTKQTFDKITLADLNPLKLFSNPKELVHAWGQRLKDIFHNPKYWLKQGAGYPVRFGIPMMLIIPFANKFLVKGSHLLFGKPKESLLDEEKFMEQQEKAQEAQMQMQQANAMNQGIPTYSTAQQAAYAGNNPNDKGAQISSRGRLVSTPQSETANKNSEQKSPEKTSATGNEKTPEKPTYTYIPSSEGVKLKPVNQQNPSELDDVLKKVDRIEQDAIKTLSI